MAFIYVITNDVNGKQYVGKTNKTIEQRFKEHTMECKRDRCNKRPLYSAMNKYGTEHFHVEKLEKCSAELSAERESYWIKQLKTYGSDGYNATKGGDGKKYYDYDIIANKYLELQNQKETAAFFNCDTAVVRQACIEKNIPIKSSQSWLKEHGHKVAMIDLKTNNVLRVFSNVSEAYHFLNKQQSGHISLVCNGKRKSAYGYKWKYSN